jgi:hypothetical protein
LGRLHADGTVTVQLDPGDIGRTTIKVDRYLLGHWPSEQERLHIGAAVAPVEYNLKDQAPGRAGAPEARLASRSPRGRLAASDVLSVAVFSIECSGLAQRYD